jgi:hypothetical protein
MEQRDRDARLAVVAGRQRGAFTFAQALAAGYPRRTIKRRIDSGAWSRRFPGVYGFGGAERTHLGDIWSSVLAVGPAAVVTHETAALIHGAERLPTSPITLTVPHGGHARLPGLVVHQVDDLVPSDICRRNGLMVSRAARVVVELGATQPVTVIGRVTDDLIRMNRTTCRDIGLVFARVARPGKPGMQHVARILDERGAGYVPPGSELERSLLAALAAGGLAAPERQLRLPGHDGVRGIRGLVDCAYPDAQLLIEADGRRWHGRLEAARRDRERDAQAARVGWQTLRFVHEQIVGDPAEVCAVVRETRAVRLDLLRRAA